MTKVALLTQETKLDGLQLRHRRTAERRQVHAVQRADRDRRGAGRELSVLHDRAECRPCRGARSAPGAAGRDRQVGKIVPTSLEFVDIAGLVRGASKGEGLGNQFLANIREVDAIIHVLRCFEDSDVTHVEGSIDPIRDAETVETELMLADLESLEKRLPACAEARARRRQGEHGAGGADRADRGRAAGRPPGPHGDPAGAGGGRPAAAAADLQAGAVCLQRRGGVGRHRQRLSRRGSRERAQAEGARHVVVSAAIEAEVSQLPEEDRPEFLEGLGPARQRPGPGDPRRLRPARPHDLFHRAGRRRHGPGPSPRAPRRRRRPA